VCSLRSGQDYPTGGDVIVAVDGTSIASADDLRNVVDQKKPGDSISVTYVRHGARHSVTMKLAKRPS